MGDFKQLKVWQKAHSLAVAVSDDSARIKSPTHLSLRSQMVRTAMSIDANIVEGRGRGSDRDYARFLTIAAASALELESHLLMARDTGAMRESDTAKLLDRTIEVRRMLYGLINSLRS